MNNEDIKMIEEFINRLEEINQSIGEERYKVKIKKELNGRVLTEHIKAALIARYNLIEIISLYSNEVKV